MFDCVCCRPASLGRRGFLAAAVSAAALPAALPAWGQTPPTSAGPANAALLDDLVVANHILYEQGVVDGFGHISVRHDKDPNRYLLSRSMAPAQVTTEDIIEYDLDSVPIGANGRTSNVERFIHGEIYKRRPDVT